MASSCHMKITEKSLFPARQKEDKFQGVVNFLKGQTILDLLTDEFYLLWKIKNLFSKNVSIKKICACILSFLLNKKEVFILFKLYYGLDT